MSQRRFILKLTKDYIIPIYKSCDQSLCMDPVKQIGVKPAIFTLFGTMEN